MSAKGTSFYLGEGGSCSPRKFEKLGSLKCHFLHFDIIFFQLFYKVFTLITYIIQDSKKKKKLKICNFSLVFRILWQIGKAGGNASNWEDWNVCSNLLSVTHSAVDSGVVALSDQTLPQCFYLFTSCKYSQTSCKRTPKMKSQGGRWSLTRGQTTEGLQFE